MGDISSAPIGVQLERLQSYLRAGVKPKTSEEILTDTGVDIDGNQRIRESLADAESKVIQKKDGKWRLKSIYHLRHREDLFMLLSRSSDGIVEKDLLNSYKGVEADIAEMKRSCHVHEVRTGEHVVLYPRDTRPEHNIEDDLKVVSYDSHNGQGRTRYANETDSNLVHETERCGLEHDYLEPYGDERTVFVWRLVPKADENDVFNFFSSAGEVRDVILIMDSRKSQHKGAGFVKFYDKKTAEIAVELSGGSISGFPVAVTPSAVVKLLPRTGTELARSPQPMPNDDPGTGLPSTSAPGRSTSQSSRHNTENRNSLSGIYFGIQSMKGSKLATTKDLKAMLNPHNIPSNSISPRALPGPLQSTVCDIDHNLSPPTDSSYSSFKRLYVGSVSYQLSERELHSVFARFGKIAWLKLERENGTRRSRGYGFVEYAEHSSARKALSMNGTSVAGRPMKVEVASTAPKKRRAIGGMSKFNGARQVKRRNGVVLNVAKTPMPRKGMYSNQDYGKKTLSPSDVSWNKPLRSTHVPFKSVVLRNMFDPAAKRERFEEGLAEEVRAECSAKFGTVTHLFVDKLSQGLVYIRFATIEASRKAMSSLNRGCFHGQRISAAYIPDDVYRQRFLDSL